MEVSNRSWIGRDIPKQLKAYMVGVHIGSKLVLKKHFLHFSYGTLRVILYTIILACHQIKNKEV